MESNGSPQFTPSDYPFMGSNTEGNYMSYPNGYDMISSGSPAFNPLALSGNMPTYHMNQPSFAATRVTSPRAFTSTQTVSPPLTAASGSDVSGENLPSGGGYTAYGPMRRGRQSTSDSNTSSSSAPSRNGGSLVQRHGLRYPPNSTSSTVMAAGGRHRRRESRDDDDDDDFDSDTDAFRPAGAPQEVVVQRRREEIRKQRIESEQRRRDELRDGYRRLKDVLPVSNQKSSKVSLLDRATSHIKYLEMMQHQLQTNLTQSDIEVARLRQVNEALMLSAAERRGAGQSSSSQPPVSSSNNASPKPEATSNF
ncbi:helix loop helix DNA-binding domain protein [Ceratobasidium sp. AG-Ba]|nr:helix loop helix DNA-binding domain protein [Ceratobasidium sp. AG-Ba]QRW11961.1 helix loop helix DNA-binding domain protein [Ceratobasidium sp. AG-Ba]